MSRTYRDLVAWQKAMQLVTEVYRASAALPKEEIYGLTSQLRRAAVSIPSNIAEGQGRKGAKEFQQFLAQARGSLLELETQLLIAQSLGYLPAARAEQLLALTAQVGRLLNGLVNSLN